MNVQARTSADLRTDHRVGEVQTTWRESAPDMSLLLLGLSSQYHTFRTAGPSLPTREAKRPSLSISSR